DSYGLAYVRLTTQLDRIKEVVRSWKDTDAALQSCKASGKLDPRKRGMCSGPLPTKGLVGFLSGKSTGGKWEDEYLGVDATVHGAATKFTNGVTFSGAGAGAEWPVGKLGQNQPYYFANNEFALAVTVTIHAVPEEDGGPIPLLRVKMDDAASTVLFELSYNHERKWLSTPHRGAAEGSLEQWEPNKTYQVTLEFEKDEWNVHVDGSEIYGDTHDDSIFDASRISHFCFGADAGGGAASSQHVTLANVLLYNDLLAEDAVEKLSDGKVDFPRPAAKPEVPPPTSGGGGPAPQARPEDKKGEKSSLPDKGPAGSESDSAVSTPQVPPAKPNPEPHAGTGGPGGTDGGVTPDSKGGAKPPSTEPVAGDSRNKGAEVPKGDNTTAGSVPDRPPPPAPGQGGKASPGVDVAPKDAGAAPGPEGRPTAPKVPPLPNGTNVTGSIPNDGNGDGSVHGGLPRVMLLTLLGLCGIAALC
ncbi:trans-sialidase, partial [Trypanosoma conorhini]